MFLLLLILMLNGHCILNTFFQSFLSSKADLYDNSMTEIAVWIFHLPDKISDPLLMGQLCVDVNILYIHQLLRVYCADVHLAHFP